MKEENYDEPERYYEFNAINGYNLNYKICRKKVGIKAGLLWKKSKEADYCFEKFEDILSVF